MGIMPIGCIRDKEGVDGVVIMFIECERLKISVSAIDGKSHWNSD
jgi:hypothetical protein